MIFDSAPPSVLNILTPTERFAFKCVVLFLRPRSETRSLTAAFILLYINQTKTNCVVELQNLAKI